MRNEEPGGNFLANQKKWMAELEGFLTKFGKSDEAPEVWLQLGSSNEFNAEEDKARAGLHQARRELPRHAGRQEGRRRPAAARPGRQADRHQGNEPAGRDGRHGRSIAASRCWWCSGPPGAASRSAASFPTWSKLHEKYQGKGLEVVGVSLDNEKADLEAFLKEQPMPWPQIFEPGGIDSRLATEYGIISLPTMFLIDGQGKVVSRSLRTASEVERQLDKLLAQKQPGVALGGER